MNHVKNVAGNDVSIFLFRFELSGNGINFVLKRTVAMGFPEQGVSRSTEGDQRWYRASLRRYLRGEIFVKTGVYRCHNLLKDVLFLFDERGFLTALPFA